MDGMAFRFRRGEKATFVNQILCDKGVTLKCPFDMIRDSLRDT